MNSLPQASEVWLHENTRDDGNDHTNSLSDAGASNLHETAYRRDPFFPECCYHGALCALPVKGINRIIYPPDVPRVSFGGTAGFVMLRYLFFVTILYSTIIVSIKTFNCIINAMLAERRDEMFISRVGIDIAVNACV